MSTVSTAIGTAAIALPSQEEHKLIDLAVVKKGARDYLSFLDETKEVLFAYLYHRTGSLKTAQTLMIDVYLDMLKLALAPWWFGMLTMRSLIRRAERFIANAGQLGEADIATVYLPTLAWLAPEEQASAALLHENLWTLSPEDQRVFILSVLIGLPPERMAQILNERESLVEAELERARLLLFGRWQPVDGVKHRLSSLVFVPAMDIARETALRFSIVEKYNALRLRSYQWMIAGGMVALFSNFLIAGVLAFVVITQPPTSLRSARTQVAGLDALLIRRQEQRVVLDRSIATLAQESKGLAAYNAQDQFTEIGIGATRDALKEYQKLQDWKNTLKKAQAAVRRFLAVLMGQGVE